MTEPEHVYDTLTPAELADALRPADYLAPQA